MTLLGNYFGTRAYAGLVGLTIAVQTTISAAAPSIAGYLYDQYGSYGPTVYALAVFCFAGACVLLRARPPMRGTLREVEVQGVP
jgi:cyanate permease